MKARRGYISGSKAFTQDNSQKNGKDATRPRPATAKTKKAVRKQAAKSKKANR